MLGHHIYSKNSFPAWQISSHNNPQLKIDDITISYDNLIAESLNAFSLTLKKNWPLRSKAIRKSMILTFIRTDETLSLTYLRFILMK